jgi:hypothetical protein
MPYGLLSVLMLGLLIFCLADAITRDDAQIRHLPKLLWIFLIILMPLAGSILWLAIGRPPLRLPSGRPDTPRRSEYDRPGRFVPSDPSADEEFLRRCRERAEEQRRIGKEILKAQRAEQERSAPKPSEPDTPGHDDDGASARP